VAARADQIDPVVAVLPAISFGVAAVGLVAMGLMQRRREASVFRQRCRLRGDGHPEHAVARIGRVGTGRDCR